MSESAPAPDYQSMFKHPLAKWLLALLAAGGTGTGAVKVVTDAFCQIDMNQGAIDYHHHPSVIFVDQSACYYKGREIARANSEGEAEP